MDNPYFERSDKSVMLKLDSDLGTGRPIYFFEHTCHSQEEAELVKGHFEKVLERLYEDIAQNPELYLNPEDVSRLKARLKDWHGTKHYWIR